MLFGDFDTHPQCEEYSDDEYYVLGDDGERINHDPDDEEERDHSWIDDEEDMLLNTDKYDDVVYDDNENYFHQGLMDSNGGITAEGWKYLADLDSNGCFV